MHAKGNEENVFDRLDFQLSNPDSIHVNLGFTRSWFQTPNSFDAQNATAWSGLVVDNGGLGPDGILVGPADQRSQIKTFDIAPSWTRLISPTTVFTLGTFVRRDQFNYYPSGNPFADLAPDLQQETLSQDRTLTNAGIRSDLSYVKGIHNLKAGVTYQQTFLNENNRFGIAYNVKKTNTVLRASYARVLETPFNENLVLSSTGCADPVLNPLLVCSSNVATPFSPGWRNEFHVGLQQALGRYLVFSGEYVWKYTHNAYDFGVFGSTPLTFPIEWHNSKIPAVAGRVSVPNFHGFSALFVFSSVAARVFNPQLGGAGAVPPGSGGSDITPFRIDHDEKFNQTTHIQYQPWKNGPWLGFNWRYDSGLVAGAAPVSDGGPLDLTASGLTPDQEFQAGLRSEEHTSELQSRGQLVC